jgi:hypothetical protein
MGQQAARQSKKNIDFRINVRKHNFETTKETPCFTGSIEAYAQKSEAMG